ncbi:response regulator transcription factor [Actinomycetospora endophytica]|uniref:Response regulator transcription factor n=1 Tax=Actinomycetospora endophytica TaxID=2291215 RepID=A0ABS8PG86_9PSEU|nr:response regulator transcription factor [Actinomycetospora endophytica]MCD2197280.1 response regulator transcription factor [Actinomycetospora endophytica]
MLVVDDEPGVRAALIRGLGAEGMEVVAVGDGPTGLAQAETGAFDVVVLDVVLPGLSGYRVLERLRAGGVETPVLLLSAKDGEVDQADGLDLGADGYVVKPFSFVVLVAQLRALLRRRGPAPARVVLGALTVDPGAGTASWEGREIELSNRETGVLHVLATRQGETVTKDELLTAVWGEGAAAPNVVEVYVGYLRRKLAAAGAGELVTTVRGRGYRLDLVPA